MIESQEDPKALAKLKELESCGVEVDWNPSGIYFVKIRTSPCFFDLDKIFHHHSTELEYSHYDRKFRHLKSSAFYREDVKMNKFVKQVTKDMSRTSHLYLQQNSSIQEFAELQLKLFLNIKFNRRISLASSSSMYMYLDEMVYPVPYKVVTVRGQVCLDSEQSLLQSVKDLLLYLHAAAGDINTHSFNKLGVLLGCLSQCSYQSVPVLSKFMFAMTLCQTKYLQSIM